MKTDKVLCAFLKICLDYQRSIIRDVALRATSLIIER